jgi:hypothetical protein
MAGGIAPMLVEIAKAIFELVAMIVACQLAAFRGSYMVGAERKAAEDEAERIAKKSVNSTKYGGRFC